MTKLCLCVAAAILGCKRSNTSRVDSSALIRRADWQWQNSARCPLLPFLFTVLHGFAQFTMRGIEADPQAKGIIPRAFEQLFEQMERSKENGALKDPVRKLSARETFRLQSAFFDICFDLFPDSS